MKSTNERLSALEQLLSDSITDGRALRSDIAEGFRKIDENFITVATNIQLLDKKLESFSGNTDENLKEVSLHLTSIKEEIVKINQVTGYEEEHNNLKIVRRS